MSDTLERIRMCLAEAGYDPRAATEREDGIGIAATMYGVPGPVMWRAFALTHTEVPCLACYDLDSADRCLGEDTMSLDCGVSRD